MRRVRRSSESALGARLDAVVSHQPSHPLLSDGLASSGELRMDPRPPIPFTARPVDRSDLGGEATVVDLSRARLGVRPFVVPTARNPERAAKQTDLMIGPLRVHKLEVYELCFAKKAAAFFKIVFSSSSSLTFFRSSRSSACSGVSVARTCRMPISSPYFFFHECRRFVGTPRLSATSSTVRSPRVSTRRTASRLNSSGYFFRLFWVAMLVDFPGAYSHSSLSTKPG